MKTLFFSAIEVPTVDITNPSEDDPNTSENVEFNTHHILNPHDVLSAIKVRLKILDLRQVFWGFLRFIELCFAHY